MTKHDFNEAMMPEYVPDWSSVLEHQKIPLLLKVQDRTRLNPITWEDLAEKLSLAWEEVWAIVERLWTEREPICTDGDAFWYPTDSTDTRDTQAYLERQARRLIEQGETLKQTAERMRAREETHDQTE